jgi:hypothetical protein
VVDVLAAVNDFRAQHGMAPIGEMPKGHRRKGNSCPLARATGAEVSRATICMAKWQPLPPVLYRFRLAFDGGFYPELEA